MLVTVDEPVAPEVVELLINSPRVLRNYGSYRIVAFYSTKDFNIYAGLERFEGYDLLGNERYALQEFFVGSFEYCVVSQHLMDWIAEMSNRK